METLPWGFEHIKPGARLDHKRRGMVTVLSEPFYDGASTGHFKWWVVVRDDDEKHGARQTVACGLLREPITRHNVEITLDAGCGSTRKVNMSVAAGSPAEAMHVAERVVRNANFNEGITE